MIKEGRVLEDLELGVELEGGLVRVHRALRVREVPLLRGPALEGAVIVGFPEPAERGGVAGVLGDPPFVAADDRRVVPGVPRLLAERLPRRAGRGQEESEEEYRVHAHRMRGPE
jgi:hypothetical protein